MKKKEKLKVEVPQLFNKINIYGGVNQGNSGTAKIIVTTDFCTSLGTNDASDCGDASTSVMMDTIVTTREFDTNGPVRS
jgi:hypothetical protein